MSNRPISKQSELVLFARVAREIGFSPATAEQLAEAGEFLPPIWLGSRRYLFRRDVDTWLAAKRATKHSNQRR